MEAFLAGQGIRMQGTEPPEAGPARRALAAAEIRTDNPPRALPPRDGAQVKNRFRHARGMHGLSIGGKRRHEPSR